MNIKGAVFDMDGTLLDSMELWDTMGSGFLIRRGITPEEDIDKKYKSMSIVEAAEYYRDHYGLTESVDQIRSQINGYVEDGYRNRVKTKKGVVEFLNRLKQQGVKMAVATSTDRYLVEIALEQNGIRDFFQHILTCTEYGCDKNTPYIYLKAFELLGVEKDEGAVFEDAPHAIRAAKSGDLTVVGVADSSYTAERPELEKMCDIFIDSYDELLDNRFTICKKTNEE